MSSGTSPNPRMLKLGIGDRITRDTCINYMMLKCSGSCYTSKGKTKINSSIVATKLLLKNQSPKLRVFKKTSKAVKSTSPEEREVWVRE